MKYLVVLSVLSFGGLVTIVTMFSIMGVDGWWVFLVIFAPFVGVLGLFALAREGLETAAGYRKWRWTVRMVLASINTGSRSVNIRALVGALADPDLKAAWDRAEEEEQDWERGGHSER